MFGFEVGFGVCGCACGVDAFTVSFPTPTLRYVVEGLAPDGGFPPEDDDATGAGVVADAGAVGFGLGKFLVSGPGTILPCTRLRRPGLGDEDVAAGAGAGVVAGAGAGVVAGAVGLGPGITLPCERCLRPGIGDEGDGDDVGGGVVTSGPLTSDPETVVVVPRGLNCRSGLAAAPVGPLCALAAALASSLASISAFSCSTDFDGFLLLADLSPGATPSLKYDSCKN
jgi:hypothetical protein